MPTISTPTYGGPTRSRVLLANGGALALTLGTVLVVGVNPRVLLFAFILAYAGQMVLLDFLLRVHRRSPSEGVRNALRWVSREPRPGEVSSPLIEQNSGKALRLGGYLLVWIVLAYFAFMLAHVNAEKELEFAWAMFGREMAWACLFTAVYLGQDLLARTLIVDFDASAETNFGYNSKEVGVLGCAVLLGGMMVVVRQSVGAAASAWVIMGPLVALRHLNDLFTDLQTARAYRRP